MMENQIPKARSTGGPLRSPPLEVGLALVSTICKECSAPCCSDLVGRGENESPSESVPQNAVDVGLSAQAG